MSSSRIPELNDSATFGSTLESKVRVLQPSRDSIAIMQEWELFWQVLQSDLVLNSPDKVYNIILYFLSNKYFLVLDRKLHYLSLLALDCWLRFLIEKKKSVENYAPKHQKLVVAWLRVARLRAAAHWRTDCEHGLSTDWWAEHWLMRALMTDSKRTQACRC